MDQISRLINSYKKNVKKVPSIVAASLPIATVIGNVIDIVVTTPADRPQDYLVKGIQRYAGINILDGSIRGEEFMKGAGSLIISGLVGVAIKALT